MVDHVHEHATAMGRLEIARPTQAHIQHTQSESDGYISSTYIGDYIINYQGHMGSCNTAISTWL